MNHHRTPAEIFQLGLEKHGIESSIHTNPDSIDFADLIVLWGIRNVSKIKNKCYDYLVMERAYFEPRNKFISLGFNGLNGNANFVNENMPSDRWNQYFSNYMKPWRETQGDYILLTTQVKGDQSICNLNFDYSEIISKIRANTNMRIMVKHHPVRKSDWGELNVNELNRKVTIEDAVKNAHITVTVNSNSGVDSILAGIPVLNIDKGSMVWNLALQNDFTRINDPLKPDRMQWAYNTAYCQWLPNEILDGHAWDHLKQFYK